LTTERAKTVRCGGQSFPCWRGLISPRSVAASGRPPAGGRQRVDRVHLVAGGHQRHHPQTPIGLDPYRHPGGIVRVGSDQLMALRHPGHPLRQAPAGQHLAPPSITATS